MEVLKSLQESIGTQLGDKGLNLIGALLLLIVGLIVLKFVKKIIKKTVDKLNLDSKLPEDSKIEVGTLVSKLIYYLLVIFLLMSVLNLLGISDVFDPIKVMLNKFLGFIPNIIAAGIIGYVGYMIAKLVSEGVGFLATKLDTFSEKMGLSNNIDLGKIVKQIVFIIVFVPILIVALDAMQMEAISTPAKLMLQKIFASIPNIIAAVIIIAVFFIGGKFFVAAVKELLKGLNVDELSEKIHLKSIIGDVKLTNIIGGLLFFFIAFTGIISALEKLEFTSITTVLNDLLMYSGKIAFGLLIMIIGNFVANIAYKAASKSENGAALGTLARVVVLGLFISLALNSMGIADDIVNLAFGLTLGAVAIAFALSFGLGGREAAGEQMKRLFEKFNKKD